MIIDEQHEAVLMIIFNGMTFSKTQAASIVGGHYRLEKLVDKGLIRKEKPNDVQNGKWFCNAWDCIKHADIKYLRDDYGKQKQHLSKDTAGIK